MRNRVVLLAGLVLAAGGCTAMVRDLEPGKRTDGDAFLAGSLSFGDSRVSPRMQWRAEDGKRYDVRPGAGAFLVAVPAGRYELTRFGAYRVTDDTITFQAVAGETRYIGTFEAARDKDGQLRIALRDRRAAVQKKLGEVHEGVTLTPGLVRSALVPLEGNDGDLVIAVRYFETSTFYYGGGHGFYSHSYGGHRRGHRGRRHGGRSGHSSHGR